MMFFFIATCFFYFTLLLELTVWHVPSIASTANIFTADESVLTKYSLTFRQVFFYRKSVKYLLFVFPLFFVYYVHLIPAKGAVDLFVKSFAYDAKPYALASILVVVGRLFSLVYLAKMKEINSCQDNDLFLHTDGIFSFSRNPGLVGLYISFAGFLLVYFRIDYLVSFFIYIGYMHFKVLMEEDYLSNQFGEKYRSFKSNSNRYLWF